MPLINRGPKSQGGDQFADGSPALASEVNFDFNELFALVSGNLDEENIGSIDWSVISGDKEASDIEGISYDQDEQETDSSPGTQGADDGGSETLAQSLADELKQLRYAVKRQATGISAVRENGNADPEPVSWIESPFRGSNLVANPRFEHFSDTATPYDWVEVLTPTVLVTGAPGVRETQINCDVANEGIKQTVTGLKANTRYLVKLSAYMVGLEDSATFSTSGADVTSEWRDASISIAVGAGIYSDYLAVVQPDADAKDIEVRILSDQPCVIWLEECGMWEISDAPITSRHAHYLERDYETAATTVGTVLTQTGCSITVTPPSLGYVVRVRGVVSLDGATISGRLFTYINKDAGTKRIASSYNGVVAVDDDDDGFAVCSTVWYDFEPGVAPITYTLWTKKGGDATGTWSTAVEGINDAAAADATHLVVELIPMRLE